MREFLSANIVATTLRMLRSTFKGSFLLVEGATDARLFKRLIDASVCHVQICNNRANVLKVTEILDLDGFVGHIGLIDQDFAAILGERFQSENIVTTDGNDVELMIFESDVLGRFLVEYTNPDKITALENQMGCSIRDGLVKSASELGTLRILSKMKNWHLKFCGATIQYAARRDISVNRIAQIEHLRGRSGGTTMPGAPDVDQEMSNIQLQFQPLVDHVCGHDICEVISKGTHEVFGRARVALGRTGLAVEEVFRASYTRLDFEKSELFAGMRIWERKRMPYRVL